MALQSDPAASRPRRTAMSPASNVEKAREARKSCWAFRVARNFLPGSPPSTCVCSRGACACTRAGVQPPAHACKLHARTRVCSRRRERVGSAEPARPQRQRTARSIPPRSATPGQSTDCPCWEERGEKKKELFLLLEQTLRLAEGWMGTACAGRRAHSQHPGPQMLRSVSSRLCRRLDFSRPAESHPMSPK